ncbi:MAG TPA: hypothetical protein VE404_09425 [Verrucomicrobiae bacterium]|nr:hypothetical protein [Verrucomicrobiae bacterium]
MPVHRRGSALAVVLAFMITPLLVSAAEPGPLVAGSPEIEIQAPAGMDVSRIRAAAESALLRFRLLFPVSRETLGILIDPDGAPPSAEPAGFAAQGVACVRWAAPARELEVSPGAELAHKIGHALLVARLRREVDGGASPGCDASRRHDELADLPPVWLDEAIAAWCEGAGAREARVRRVTGEIPAAIPLWRLLVARRDAPASFSEDGSGEEVGQAFADESYAVGEFLFGRGGFALAGQLAVGAARGRATTCVLAHSAELPGDVDELQREWEDWLRERRPAAGDAGDSLAAP